MMKRLLLATTVALGLAGACIPLGNPCTADVDCAADSHCDTDLGRCAPGARQPSVDAGPSVAPPTDGGTRDEPCLNGRCRDDTLVCISEASGGDTTQTCRLACDTNDDTDPCGERSTCSRLTNNDGACLPAGQVDDECPCDEGFVCVALDPGQLCKTACIVDAGSPTCDPNETCTALANSTVDGACI
jgi:hypothetical protein